MATRKTKPPVLKVEHPPKAPISATYLITTGSPAMEYEIWSESRLPELEANLANAAKDAFEQDQGVQVWVLTDITVTPNGIQVQNLPKYEDS